MVEIPEGWQLVPVEPTREMVEAWWRCHFREGPSSDAETYAEMLAVAPVPPVSTPTPAPDFEAVVGHFANAARDYASAWQCDRHEIARREAEYGAARSALLARYEEMRVRLEWQPIETAPKDGTVILLTGGVYHGAPFSGSLKLSEFFPDDPWFNAVSQHRLPYHCVTKWMPLPEGSEFAARHALNQAPETRG